MWCWGRDDRGQLGNGAGADRATPAEVPGLGHGVTAAAAGYAHTCALLTDGTLWCWGRNDYGQLGDGTTNDSVAPVQVSALGTNVVEVAAGTFHTCARLNDGTVSCWGRDYYGQLGDGMVANQASPVPVTALGNGVAEIVAGTSHTCARKTDGSVWCWGRNYIGELGVGSTANHATPVPVTALSAGAVQLAAGDDHTCARFADGTVQCWGSGTSGECGDGSTSDHLSPVLAGAATGPYVDVAAGWDHTCARTGTGLWCWGSNGEGELGDGSTTSRSSPEQISAVGAKVTQVAAGDSHTCAREDDGTVWCWGRNDFAQLGHPGGPYSSLAVQVAVIGACP